MLKFLHFFLLVLLPTKSLSELFIRQHKYKIDNRCFQEAQIRNENGTCRDPVGYGLNAYVDSEIEGLCNQLWLTYDILYSICKTKSARLNWVNKFVLTYEGLTMRRTNSQCSKDDLIDLAKKRRDKMTSIHLYRCLIIGAGYSPLTKRCCGLRLVHENASLFRTFAPVIKLQYNKVWVYFCSLLLLEWNKDAQMCLDTAHYNMDLFHDFKDNSVHPQYYLEELKRAVNGLKLIDDRIYLNSKMSILEKDFYLKKRYLSDQVKDIHCSFLGLGYNRFLKMCVQNLTRLDFDKSNRHFLPTCQNCIEKSLYEPDRSLANELTDAKNEFKCLRFGMIYSIQKGECEAIEKIHNVEVERTLTHYQYFLYQTIRLNCYRHDLGFDESNLICIRKTFKDGYRHYNAVELLLKDKNKYINNRIFDCVQLGTDYDKVKDTCILHSSKLKEHSHYNVHRKHQLTIACDLFYHSQHKFYKICHNMTSSIKRKSAADLHLEAIASDQNFKAKLISATCEKLRLSYSPTIGICILTRPKELRKFFNYETNELYKERYCYTLGSIYDPISSKCQSINSKTSRAQIQKIRKLQIQNICYREEMDYDIHLGFCVKRRTKEEWLALPIPIIEQGDGHPDSTCFKAGMYFANNKCNYFDLSNKRQVEEYKYRYKLLAKSMYMNYCSISKLQFDSDLAICVQKDKNVVINLIKESKSRENNLNNKIKCFMLGLRLSQNQCVPHEKRANKDHAMLRLYFLSIRCPLYMVFSKELDFCIRKPSRSARAALTIKPTELENCCIKSGLMYYRNKCVTWPLSLYPNEAQAINKKYFGVMSEHLEEYCLTAYMGYNKHLQICQDSL